MADFHFLRPQWLTLLPLLAIIVLFYHRRKARSRSWRAVCDPILLRRQLIAHSAGTKGVNRFATLLFGGSLALVALAGPVWMELEQPVFRDQSAWVFVLDLSRSMDATDIKPKRITRARHKLIDMLKRQTEGQSALIVYAADAFVVSPLTEDADTIVSQVLALKTSLMPRQGSRPSLALRKAHALLRQAGAPKARVLLMTDGLEQVDQKALDTAIDALRSEGHRLSVVGVGTTEGGPIDLKGGGFFKDKLGEIVIPRLDEGALRQLAVRGGGLYQTFTVDDSDMNRLFKKEVLANLQNQGEETGLKTDRWQEEGPWLLLPLLPIVALVFRRGILAAMLLFFLLLPSAAMALDWEALWSTPNQQAAALFSEGEAKAAAKRFKDPAWKAASQFVSGDYEGSIASLEGLDDADALYNKGNALAKLGRLPEALEAYEASLKREPEHADARYNKEQVEKQLEPQKQEKGDQQKEDGDPSEDQESSDEQEDGGQNDSESGEPSESSDDQESSEESDEQKEQQDEKSSESESKEEEKEEEPSESEEANAEEMKEDKASEDDAQEVEQTEEEREAAEAMAQWLRRIPDDPGGLLRRKFLFQSRKQQRQGGSQRDVAW